MTITAVPSQLGVAGAHMAPAGGTGIPHLPGMMAELQLHAVKRISLTVGEADLTAGATTQSLNLGAALPAGAMMMGVNVRLATPFTGGGITAFIVSVGTAGDDDAVLASANIFAAAVDGQASAQTAGIAPNKLFPTSQQLLAKFTSTTANVSAATAGQCTIDVLYTEATP